MQIIRELLKSFDVVVVKTFRVCSDVIVFAILL